MTAPDLVKWDLADELQIRNLIARVAHAADTADPERLRSEYLDCFTDDAVFELRTSGSVGSAVAGVMRGKAEILASALDRRRIGLQGPGTHTMHVVTSTALHVGGDEARAQSSFMFLGRLNASPVIQVAGLYDDQFRKVQGKWRIAHRRAWHP